ncbi:hypothetical protein BOX15_Mlig031280g3 [Macrostomum lignano]|uniref:Uncharacterized protein n=1 Tax=Macrostomum lignano TaxID=282301 RepID=A0A267G649_9PLAT|nr:hypothetical protein BOX15_Mlig031280g3 [Macrostomum lignano]
MSEASLPAQQNAAEPSDESSSSSASIRTIGNILVSAPETAVTELLCGASLCIRPGRRGAKQMLGSIISARAFDLTEVGQAPGLEREYAEEHDLPTVLDDCPDDISDDTSIGSDTDSIDEVGARGSSSASETTIIVDIDENEGDDCTTITAGTIIEDSGSTPPGSTIGLRSPQPKEADLSVQIEKAVHRSLLKSIRDTSVLGTQSKKQTMLSASRAANSLFSFENDQCDENYLQELLKFDF